MGGDGMSHPAFAVLNDAPKILGDGDKLVLRRSATAVRVATGTGVPAFLRLAEPVAIDDLVITVEATTADKVKLELPAGIPLTIDGETLELATAVSTTGTEFALTLAAPATAAHLLDAPVGFAGYHDLEYAMAPGELVTSAGGTAAAGSRDSAIAATMIQVGDVKHVISASHGYAPRVGDVSTPVGRRVVAVADPTSRGLWTVWMRGAP